MRLPRRELAANCAAAAATAPLGPRLKTLKTRKIHKGKKSRSFLIECALDDPNNFDKQRFNMLLKEIESNHINQIDFIDQKNNIRRNQKKFQLRKLKKDFPESNLVPYIK